MRAYTFKPSSNGKTWKPWELKIELAHLGQSTKRWTIAGQATAENSLMEAVKFHFVLKIVHCALFPLPRVLTCERTMQVRSGDMCNCDSERTQKNHTSSATKQYFTAFHCWVGVYSNNLIKHLNKIKCPLRLLGYTTNRWILHFAYMRLWNYVLKECSTFPPLNIQSADVLLMV